MKNSINVNDVLTVSREYHPDFTLGGKETGMALILLTSGDYFFEGEVIGGELHPGYLAKKGTVACFVTSFAKIIAIRQKMSDPQGSQKDGGRF
ncbi:hypothetical protein [Geobacter sp. AOG2]|uniref:hypothetical protein n=1 Tax=Geobacter sp. AOG2 TaxID=1566347 RepID=UPI001CC7B081|nr:hypothetical protein [Geobacter sp. AOG2]